VHAWRAATVKTLASSASAPDKIQKGYHEYLEHTLLRFCGNLVRSDLQQAEKDDLLHTVAAFGDFAIELWSQKYCVQYSCLNAFENRPYSLLDEDMELARAVGVEEGDTSLNGRPIPCLVQPLIRGCGSNDGKDYNKYRVWSKAVVWVSKDGKAASTQTTMSRKS
jgi:hypothetical protein